MNAGNVIALIIGLLMVAAIYWFMTRAGRGQKNDSSVHLTRPSASAGSAATDQVPAKRSADVQSTADEPVGTTASARSTSGLGIGAAVAGAGALAGGSGAVVAGARAVAASPSSSATSAQTALSGDYTVATGDPALDVREMLKILNLRESDAKRLAISESDYKALKAGNSVLPPEDLTAVAEKLRAMIL